MGRPAAACKAQRTALRFETGQARLAGRFPELEDQLCALSWAGYHGPGSPDRADAMAGAMTDLFEKPRAEPRIRFLQSVGSVASADDSRYVSSDAGVALLAKLVGDRAREIGMDVADHLLQHGKPERAREARRGLIRQ